MTPFVFPLERFPLSVRVLPVPARKRFVTAAAPLLITKLLVIVASLAEFVAHSLLVKNPKVDVCPDAEEPIEISQACDPRLFCPATKTDPLFDITSPEFQPDPTVVLVALVVAMLNTPELT